MLQSQQLLSSNFYFPLPFSNPQNPSLSPSHSSSFPLNFLNRPITLHSVSAHLRTRPQSWLAQAPESTTAAEEDGPIELPPSTPSIFATSDDPSPLQATASLLLTGAISIFLFRSLRRRAKRAKELKFRSSGAKKSLKEEAIDSLKAITPSVAETKGPPSPVQTLLGGISAGVVALILYKFTTTVESSLNRQTLSDNFSVRQITITIRYYLQDHCKWVVLPCNICFWHQFCRFIPLLGPTCRQLPYGRFLE
ncbi:hypothetical protein U1Q18_024231 [Sarracenia purpurea var. burkii]